MSDEIIRKGADAPIETTVTTSRVTRGEAPCAHGFEVVTVDGEDWHQDGLSVTGRPVWHSCDPQLELLPKKRKGAR